MTAVLPERLRERVALDDPLAIIEAAQVVGPIRADGTILMHVIRPCVGRGKGGHYYSPQMLQENAHVFRGARMFLNHETEEQRRARKHLPRPVEQLAGRILEAHWDGSVPADGRYEQGAVVAVVKPRRIVREIVEDDPELLEVSINALATGKHMGRHPGTGRHVPIVEGIRPSPLTVDFIAGEGGAGGRILQESALDEEEAVLESLSDDDFMEYLAEQRPDLLETLRENSGGVHNDRRRENDDVPEITAEALTEALATDEGKAALLPILQEAVKELELPGPTLDEAEITRIVEARVAEQTDLATIQSREQDRRDSEVRAMHAKATSLIEGSKLHTKLKERLHEDFSLTESGAPSAKLDVKPELDADGNVVKSALTLLEESVKHEIDDALTLQSSLGTRTRVRGQGGSADTGKKRITFAELQETAEMTEEERAEAEAKRRKSSTGSPLTDALLTEAGVPAESLGSLWARA
jgi:hypothetical protein